MMGFPFNNRGFLGKILSTVVDKVFDFGKKTVENVPIGIGSSVGGALGGKLSDKITGIPSALSGAQQGREALDYMNAAYPGTSPWTRLGAGGAGSGAATSSIQSEKMRNKQESMLQSRELMSRNIIADKQARAQVISSAASLGIPAVKEAVSMLSYGSGRPYDTQVTLGKERQPSEISKNRYGHLVPFKSIADDTVDLFTGRRNSDKGRGAGGTWDTPDQKIKRFFTDKIPGHLKFNSLPKN